MFAALDDEAADVGGVAGKEAAFTPADEGGGDVVEEVAGKDEDVGVVVAFDVNAVAKGGGASEMEGEGLGGELKGDAEAGFVEAIVCEVEAEGFLLGGGDDDTAPGVGKGFEDAFDAGGIGAGFDGAGDAPSAGGALDLDVAVEAGDAQVVDEFGLEGKGAGGAFAGLVGGVEAVVEEEEVGGEGKGEDEEGPGGAGGHVSASLTKP